MSRYPVKYVSASRGEVEIESMATPHLANAWRKVRVAHVGATKAEAGKCGVLQASMEQELVSRGCTMDAETGQWAFPPKPGDDIDKEGT